MSERASERLSMFVALLLVVAAVAAALVLAVTSAGRAAASAAAAAARHASYVCASSNNGFVRLLLISFDRVSICVFSLSLLFPNTLFGDYISVVKR